MRELLWHLSKVAIAGFCVGWTLADIYVKYLR